MNKWTIFLIYVNQELGRCTAVRSNGRRSVQRKGKDRQPEQQQETFIH